MSLKTMIILPSFAPKEHDIPNHAPTCDEVVTMAINRATMPTDRIAAKNPLCIICFEKLGNNSDDYMDNVASYLFSAYLLKSQVLCTKALSASRNDVVSSHKNSAHLRGIV